MDRLEAEIQDLAEADAGLFHGRGLGAKSALVWRQRLAWRTRSRLVIHIRVHSPGAWSPYDLRQKSARALVEKGRFAADSSMTPKMERPLALNDGQLAKGKRKRPV